MRPPIIYDNKDSKYHIIIYYALWCEPVISNDLFKAFDFNFPNSLCIEQLRFLVLCSISSNVFLWTKDENSRMIKTRARKEWKIDFVSMYFSPCAKRITDWLTDIHLDSKLNWICTRKFNLFQYLKPRNSVITLSHDRRLRLTMIDFQLHQNVSQSKWFSLEINYLAGDWVATFAHGHISHCQFIETTHEAEKKARRKKRSNKMERNWFWGASCDCG